VEFAAISPVIVQLPRQARDRSGEALQPRFVMPASGSGRQGRLPIREDFSFYASRWEKAKFSDSGFGSKGGKSFIPVRRRRKTTDAARWLRGMVSRRFAEEFVTSER